MPTRSEIEEWDTCDLTDAAVRWRALAEESEEAFAQHRANIVSTEWSGDAKDAAVNRVTADAVVVGNHGHVQREGAQIAEDGGNGIRAAKREALEAIAEAEANGFEVGEDLAVRDTRRIDVTTMAERTMAAREHAEDIRWFAERLVQADELAGKRLQEKAVELEGIRFEGEGRDSSVQLVDNEIKLNHCLRSRRCRRVVVPQWSIRRTGLRGLTLTTNHSGAEIWIALTSHHR